VSQLRPSGDWQRLRTISGYLRQPAHTQLRGSLGGVFAQEAAEMLTAAEVVTGGRLRLVGCSISSNQG
jgi:hypothetical protein